MVDKDTEQSEDVTPANKPRFSLAAMLAATTIACLVMALIVITLRMKGLEDRLNVLGGSRVLLPDEVASQFEAQTDLGGVLKTKVLEVRYNPERDSYRVKFSYTVIKTGDQWFTDVNLEPDGYGVYIGKIINSPFLEASERDSQYIVAVEAPAGYKR